MPERRYERLPAHAGRVAKPTLAIVLASEQDEQDDESTQVSRQASPRS